LALGYKYYSKAGDVVSPADGKTRISTKEGGLLEVSPNDDVVAAPGIASNMSNSVAGGDSSAVVAALNKQNLLLQQIASAISNPPPVQIGPKVISELSSVMEVERSYRS
jgi:hypothetical protein